MGIVLNNLANESKETDKKKPEITDVDGISIAFGNEQIPNCNELISEQNLLRVINMTGNTAHFSHAFFMKFFSEFQ